MEACIRNLIKEDEKALFLSIGDFGERWYRAGLACGKNSVKAEVDWGKAIKPEFLKEALSKDKYSVVFLQSNETSTGVYNPLYELVPIIKDYGALVCIDATSSLAGVKVEVDKLDIDVILASVQKCFSLPPGMAVSSLSEAAFEKSKQVKNRGIYFDFVDMIDKNKKNQTPNTPVIPIIRGLIVQLDYILNKEGIENRFERHTRLGKRTRIWARDMNLEMFPEKGYESNTVSTIKNTFNINNKEMLSKLTEKGYKIVDGYGNLAQKTFRIGHMGDVSVKELEDMLKALSDIITDLRLKTMKK
jgi:aspartate aminotransferase-like enzyme